MNIIKPAINLSPFERYLYAYNITKLFKKYKESDNKNDSRKRNEGENEEKMLLFLYLDSEKGIMNNEFDEEFLE